MGQCTATVTMEEKSSLYLVLSVQFRRQSASAGLACHGVVWHNLGATAVRNVNAAWRWHKLETPVADVGGVSIMASTSDKHSYSTDVTGEVIPEIHRPRTLNDSTGVTLNARSRTLPAIGKPRWMSSESWNMGVTVAFATFCTHVAGGEFWPLLAAQISEARISRCMKSLFAMQAMRSLCPVVQLFAAPPKHWNAQTLYASLPCIT